MSDNNGWPGEPGVPLNSERDGWHWVQNGKGGPSCQQWKAGMWSISGEGGWTAAQVATLLHMRYLGPCLTPAEVEARVAAAHKEWLAELNHDTDALMEASRDSALAEAARRLEELHKNHNYDPESGTLTKKLGRYDRWPESAKAAKLEHDTGYYRAIEEGVAHIRALKGEGND